MNNDLDEEFDWRCPTCGRSCYGSDGCEHLVASRSDDSDGTCSRGVLYTDQGEIDAAFDDLYEAVLYFSMLWLAGTPKVRKILHEQAQQLTGDLARLEWAIEVLREANVEDMNAEDFEGIVPWAYYARLTIWFKDILTTLWKRQPTSLVAKNYLITHSPGLSWTGTNYWATDAIRCRAKICEEVAVLTTGICEVTQLANERIESQPDGPPSIAKAEAWIRFYRTLMTPQSDESHELHTRL